MAIDAVFLGTAVPVAQITKVTVGGTISGETFQILVNGEVIASFLDTDTVIATVVAGLVTAWEASTSPYGVVVTASDSSPDVVLTADDAGMPFIVTLNTPGGSATFTQATPTASAGPHHWDTATNWQAGVLPALGDRVFLRHSAVSILWGLDQSAVSIDKLFKERSFTGAIGLDRRAFTTAANGTTRDLTRAEYREDYLKIKFALCEIDRNLGEGNPGGSSRVKIHQVLTTGGTLHVFDSASSSQDAGLPSIRIATDDLTNAMLATVDKAPGGIGFGVDEPGEICELGVVTVSGATKTSTIVICGTGLASGTAGVTFNEWKQNGGTSKLLIHDQDLTLGSIICNAGEMTLSFGKLIPTLTVNGGEVFDNSAFDITTVNLNGGTIDTRRATGSKTYGTLNFKKGAILKRNDALLVTTLNLPANEDYTMALT